MATTLPRAGIDSVTIDGAPYDLASDLNYSTNSLKRDSLPGMDYLHGYAEKVVASKIGFTVRDSSSLGVAAFQAMTSVTVAVQLANGKKVIGVGMWTVDVQDVEAAEATIKLQFEGPIVMEA